eukprot:2712609-Amphidinium_carterae.1
MPTRALSRSYHPMIYTPDNVSVQPPLTGSLSRFIRDQHRDGVGLVDPVFQHRYIQRHDCIAVHSMVMLADLSNAVMSDPQPTVHIKENGHTRSCSLPKWCAFSRNVMLVRSTLPLDAVQRDDVTSLAVLLSTDACKRSAIRVLNERVSDAPLHSVLRRLCFSFIHMDRSSAFGIIPFLTFENTIQPNLVSFPEYKRNLAQLTCPFKPAYYIQEEVDRWMSQNHLSSCYGSLLPAIMLPSMCAPSLSSLIQEVCVTELSYFSVTHLHVSSEALEIVHGGMAPRRAYPLADPTVAGTEKRDVVRRISLIYHGSFAPFHLGHASCLLDAQQLLRSHGFEVCRMVLGCTTPKYVRKKHHGSEMFTDPRLRAELMQAVLTDIGMDTVIVDFEGHSSADALAWKYRDASMTEVFLVGSDIMKRPSWHTIIVLRSTDEDEQVAKLDIETISGTCSQKSARGLSSTQIRELLTQGQVHSEYGALSAAILQRIADGHHTSQAATVQTACLDAPAVAKAMPRKKPVRVAVKPVTIQDGVIRGEGLPCPGSSSAMDDRPPLKRKRAAPPQVTDERPPLRRCRASDPATSCRGEADPLRRLKVPGCLKFASPAFTHLATFHRMVIVPITKMLRLVPTLTARRNGDPEIRVQYVPLASRTPPLSLFMEVEQFLELSHALGYAAIIPHYYLAFTVNNFAVADRDLDTSRGQRVMSMFIDGTTHASSNCPFGDIIFSVTMHDAHHYVCIVQALTAANMGIVAGRVSQLLNEFFATHYNYPDNIISFTLDNEKCCLVQGGMREDHGAGDRSAMTIGSEECVWLSNADELSEMIQRYQDGDEEDEPPTPRPPVRRLDIDLEYDEWDIPWINWFIHCIAQELTQYKSSLTTWKQYNCTPPVATAQGVTGEEPTVHWIANEQDLARMRAEYDVQAVLEADDEAPSGRPPRDVWSHLDLHQQHHVQSSLDIIRRTLSAQFHAIPPDQWWRYFGRSPEGALVVVHGAGKQVNGSSSMKPPAGHLVAVPGASQQASRSSSMSSDSSDDACYGEPESSIPGTLPIGSIVHVPSKTCSDPLMECIAWVVRDSLFQGMLSCDIFARLRSLSWFWLSNAYRQGYLVAGVMIDTIADILGIDACSCPQAVSEATCIASGAHYLVYALSCVLQLKVRVVDYKGVPMDGFTYVGGLGLRFSSGQWYAVKLGTYVAPESVELSATLPYEPQLQSSTCQGVSPLTDAPMLPCGGSTDLDEDALPKIVSGGVRLGAFYQRSRSRMRARLQQSVRKYVMLHSGKAKTLHVEYLDRISSTSLLATFAARKRVGRAYLTLVFRTNKGLHRCAFGDPPIYANWHGKSIRVINNRYSVLSGSSPSSRKKLERDVDELVDMCEAPVMKSAPLQPVDSMSKAIQ